MEQPSTRIRYNLPVLALVVLAVVGVVIYGVIALAAQDFLWFVPGFNEKPVRIVVYNAGVRTDLQAGQRGFAELAAAVNSSLNQGVARQSGVGLSPESLQDAYTRYQTVEVYYSRPVKLHAWFNTHEPTQMLFPITGRHSDLSMVFLGGGGVYFSNSPALNTIEPIRAALRRLGF
jgi:hypothetical protein